MRPFKKINTRNAVKCGTKENIFYSTFTSSVHHFNILSLITGVDDQRLAPAALLPGKKWGIHSTGGLVGPSFGLDECRVEKISRFLTGVRIAKSSNL